MSILKVGQLVRVCQSPGIKLGDGILEYIPHDCNIHEHWNSRVVEINDWEDARNCVRIATPYYDNPYCCDWPYGVDALTLIETDDWLKDSKFKIGDKVSFIFELEGFVFKAKVGQKFNAELKAAHINKGDWIVYYKPDNYLIKRVINESQMI